MSPERPVYPVKRRREDLGLRLVDVAARAGIRAPLLSMVENGYIARFATLERIARALDTQPWALWPDVFEEAQ